MNQSNMDFWKLQFDKLLLLFVLILLILSVHHFLRIGNVDGMAWAQRAYDNMQGALLMLLTGVGGRFIQRAGEIPPVSGPKVQSTEVEKQ
jgi:hypothetical protein